MIVTVIWMFDQFISDEDFAWDVAIEPGGAQKGTHFFSNAAVVAKTSDVPETAYKWVVGIGVQPPTASWGNMLSSIQNYLWISSLLVLYPGVLIVVTIVAVYFLGEALKEVL